ncbi:MAG: inorganic phosphate transporter [Phycisphaerae bacterium]
MSVELIIVVILALGFDFVNGFHDAANAIATCVSTRALSPRNAILMARTLNFVGAITSTAVAYTVGKGVVNVAGHTDPMSIVLVALIGAIGWDLITWYWGLPSSSTHALVGGLMGAGIVSIGVKCLVWKGIRKVLLAMFVSPILGAIAGLICVSILYWCFYRSHPSRANRNFRWAQIVSAAWMSFSHGMNDAQNAMGIITLALISGHWIKLAHPNDFPVPIWVMLASALAMGMGTSAGGWRIIKTMGQRMVDLKPIDGFAAETSAGAVIVGMSLLGAPISTTHVISCAIMGTGAAKNITSVRWNVVRRIIYAWVLTIPGAALIAGLAWYIRTLFVG